MLFWKNFKFIVIILKKNLTKSIHESTRINLFIELIQIEYFY